jgi:hypothetical protein
MSSWIRIPRWAAALMSPMVDGWMGDDWFHYGVCQTNFDYFAQQMAVRGRRSRSTRVRRLRRPAGSAGDLGGRQA